MSSSNDQLAGPAPGANHTAGPASIPTRGEVDRMTDQQRDDQQQEGSRAARARVWLACHAGELAAVTAPSVIAVTVSPWAWLATVATGGLWARHERRQSQARRRAVTASPAREGLTSTNDTDRDSDSDAGQVPGEHETPEVRHG